MAQPINTTSGVVYLVGWSGTISGASLTLSGVLKLADGSAAAPSLTFTNDTDTGRYLLADGQIAESANGVIAMRIGASYGAAVNYNIGGYRFANAAGALDTGIMWDAANTLALRNGTNAQTFRAYNTYTDASNNEYAAIGWGVTGNTFDITTTKAGSGTVRNLEVYAGTGAVTNLGAAGTAAIWQINTSGNLVDQGSHTITAGTSLAAARSALGVTSADGLILSNSTAASAGAQQMSPRVRFDGFGWKTDATAASQAVSFINELLPVQGAAAPTANLLWKYAVNGGAFSTIFTLASDGITTFAGRMGFSVANADIGNGGQTTSPRNVYALGYFSAPQFYLQSAPSADSFSFTAGTNGILGLTNAAGSAGVTVDFTTDATAYFKTRAGANTAIVKANNFFGETLTANNLSSGAIVVSDSSGILRSNQAIINVSGVTAVGKGVPIIVARARVDAQTAVQTSIATFTLPASDGTFEVSANCLVTASGTHSFSLDVTYTDESNAARTLVLPVAQLAGSFVTTGLITNVTGTGPYESPVMHIRAKASTAITIRTSAGGTYTSVTFNAEGTIKQIA